MTHETFPNTEPLTTEADPDALIGEQRPSNLSPELQAMVRTPEFKEWFGDWENDAESASKIVDENGEPKLVYFGGPAGITQLSGDRRENTGADELGFYFTNRYSNARFYATSRRDRVTDETVPSSVYGVFLNVRSPYVRQTGDGVVTERVTSVPEGFDGYINDGAQELVVFSADQAALVAEEPIVRRQRGETLVA